MVRLVQVLAEAGNFRKLCLSMEKKRSIFVADQLDLVAIGMQNLFRDDPNYQVVGSANDGNDVLAFLESNEVDIVLLDVSLPGKDGIDTTREICQKNPKQIVIAYSLLDEIEYINSMLIEGARGYIVKEASLEELHEAFETVLKGGQYLSAKARESVDKGYQYTDKHIEGEYIGLKNREREIIICIAKEMTNKEISEKLFISVETVRTHRKNLMHKLNVKSAAGLVKYAVDRRWV